MDSEKGLLQPKLLDDEDRRVSSGAPRRAPRLRRLSARTKLALLFTSLLGLWLWLRVHFYKLHTNYSLTELASLEDEFEHWPLYVGNNWDIDGNCEALKKGHHWKLHRRQRHLNGKPAEKIFL